MAKRGSKEDASFFQSMRFIIGVAVALLVVAMLIPLAGSLGQGIQEDVIVGFQGVYQPGNHQYKLRIEYSDKSYQEIPMSKLPQSQFVEHARSGDVLTKMDVPDALKAAQEADLRALQEHLGTRNNVTGFMHPFSSKPVGYSTAFLRALAKNKINPKTYGGPSIVPGSVPYTKLPGGVLHIDTLSHGNSLAQCKPGQTPPQLAALQ
jgi:hypothetical protein